MSKFYGARCGPVNCVNDPLAWCERVGDQCTDGTMGDMGIEGIAPEDMQARMEQSTTKFRLDRQDHFVELGLFAACDGLEIGDKLIGISEKSDNPDSFFLKQTERFASDRERTLVWSYKGQTLFVVFERDGKQTCEPMQNPAWVFAD